MDFIWILVPLLALSIPLVAMYFEHKKNKMKLMGRSREHEQQMEEMWQLVNKLKTRIENLEAIAAGEPKDFTAGTGRGMEEIEIEEDSESTGQRNRNTAGRKNQKTN
ncbi:MAG TPA: hypothetical protein VK074_04160 [Fodinibius sp.]|nr:hypothetical protein [Fodinibius sp.]